MNILVINVSLRPYSPLKLFPIGLGYIATSMKNAGFPFDLLDIDAHRYSDEEVERRIRRKRYDVVCLGCIVTGYKIVKSRDLLFQGDPLLFPIGLAAAFVTGLLVIAGFLTFIKQHTFKPFAYYRIVLGILVLAVLG